MGLLDPHGSQEVDAVLREIVNGIRRLVLIDILSGITLIVSDGANTVTQQRPKKVELITIRLAAMDKDQRLPASAILKSSYYYSNSTNDPNFLIDDSGKIDAKFTIEPSQGIWAFDVIVKNLTNAVLPISFGTNSSVGGRQPPRTFAAQLRLTW